MALITPPPIRVQMHNTPADLSAGGSMSFSLWFGPFQIRWNALIDTVSGTGFVDRQLDGPFAEWIHQHSFQDLDEGKTAVIDDITIRLKDKLRDRLLGLGFILGLPFLFAFRGWKTRQLMESRR